MTEVGQCFLQTTGSRIQYVDDFFAKAANLWTGIITVKQWFYPAAISVQRGITFNVLAEVCCWNVLESWPGPRTSASSFLFCRIAVRRVEDDFSPQCCWILDSDWSIRCWWVFHNSSHENSAAADHRFMSLCHRFIGMWLYNFHINSLFTEMHINKYLSLSFIFLPFRLSLFIFKDLKNIFLYFRPVFISIVSLSISLSLSYQFPFSVYLFTSFYISEGVLPLFCPPLSYSSLSFSHSFSFSLSVFIYLFLTISQNVLSLFFSVFLTQFLCLCIYLFMFF